ncbi:MAG: AraC family transcriptional regulator [Pseudomonadales bacterium]|nr:AraC family transcriptional regulator [Pseudomonadales bacterium]
MVTMIYVAWLADFLREQGLAPMGLLAGTGITEDELTDPGANIDDTQYITLLRNARKHCTLAELGLEMGVRRHVSVLDRFGFVLMCCESFSESLRVGCELQSAVGRFFKRELRVVFYVEGNSGVLRVEAAPELADLRTLVIEDVLGNILATTRWVTGYDLPVQELRCAYPEPVYARTYHRYFDCPVRFGAVDTEVRFDAEFLVTPLPFANRNAGMMHRAYCRTLVGDDGSDALIERIRARVVGARGVLPSLNDCATALGLSARTLRRRLHARGVSYRVIVDETRAERARRELCATRKSMEVIANDLGFSEPTSFARAFKRWTGVSPHAFRMAKG